ncbi:MAG: 1-acyl-sn-glycerol-3-phosphate acyltransferase [Paracoccaceae bacterium]|nr:1-acyl-sn-glycerol-3-phosphate acyltransferase [Paracoccaceae bacterium]
MRDRIDPLIEERAPWLFGDSAIAEPARTLLNSVLGYDRTVALAEHFRDMPAPRVMDQLAVLLAQDVRVEGLENIPRYGPALIVANHPTGIADGIMLWHAVARIRPDLFIYANSDIMRILPQFSEIIAPVEWQAHKRSHSKTRETMAYTRAAIDAGRLGVIFPSGRLAKRRGLWLFERPWMASASMIARKFDLPVIPVNVRARNSALFYLFDLIHPTLRDITLFHETLNKGSQPYRIRIGPAVKPDALPAKSDDGIALLRRATLRLGGRRGPNVSLVDATRRPRWARNLLPEG